MMQLPLRRRSELLIRAGVNDHEVVADLVAPRPDGMGGPVDGRPLISRLVVDAHVAVMRPGLLTTAANAGIPCLIDPLTHLCQSELKAADRWVALPYGQPEALGPSAFDSEASLEELVSHVVDFEVESGATAVIPPYFYATDSQDPWFRIGLGLIERTAAHMERSGIRLPLITVFMGQLQGFAVKTAWSSGLDLVAREARTCAASALALCLSPAGGPEDGYAKVLRLFDAMQRATITNLPVISWRQGFYGPALTAAGATGYECGMGTAEQTNIASSVSNRRPRLRPTKQGGGGPGVFLEPLGRSVRTKVAAALLSNLPMRAKLMCDDERCCPQGVSSTLDHRREHSVRSRAKRLAELDGMPHRTWRLNRIEQDAKSAETLIGQGNKVLAAEGLKLISPKSAASLAAVAHHISQEHLAADGS